MKILLPLNGTSSSHRVLEYAAQLARAREAELILLRAVDPLVFSGENFASLRTAHLEREMLRAAQSYLDDINKCFLENIKVETICLVGPAQQTIRAVALRESCDLIIMAPYSYGPIARWLIGSKAEEVAHSAPCPVMLLRGQAAVQLKHILIPIDGSDESCSVLRYLGPYVGSDTRVTLLNCTGVSGEEASGNPPTAQYLERLRNDLSARLVNHPEAELVFTEEHAPEGILRWLSESDCQLVAMATHGTGGAGKIHAGSITDQLARQIDRPLLLFPPASGREVHQTV